MPLIKSGSKEAVSTNIREMMAAGHPQKQAVAAALSTARKYRKDGGEVKQSKKQVNYRLGHNSTKCENCTMFRKPQSCTAVDGVIHPWGLCDLFRMK